MDMRDKNYTVISCTDAGYKDIKAKIPVGYFMYVKTSDTNLIVLIHNKYANEYIGQSSFFMEII